MILCEEGAISAGEIVLNARWAEGQSDGELLATVRWFTELSRHPHMQETHCSGRNFDSIESFLADFRQAQAAEASRFVKKKLSAVRRREFDAQRPELILALIARDGYVCAEQGCSVTTYLTVDHVTPLSKGGTDALDNLRLLCRSHNSQKGDSSLVA